MGREKSGTQHRQRSRKQVAKARKEWVSGREVESVTVDQAVIDLRSVKPKWEGLQSFDGVWDDAVATGIAEDGKIQIARTVRVAPTNIKRNPSKDKGGSANYSHRFERRGYTRHVTKGSHAKVDLIKPCYRRDKQGVLTCPDGCRREWCPPTIVGSDDLPFVPKARIVPGPNVEQ